MSYQTRIRTAMFAFAGMLLAVSGANATPFHAVYAPTAASVTVDFDGTLQADNNTIVVSGVSLVQVDNGLGNVTTFPQPLNVYALSNLPPNNSGLAPRLSVDGSIMDIAFCSEIDCAFPGYMLAFGLTNLFPFPLLLLTTPDGTGFILFIPDTWSVTTAGSNGAIPEPAGLAVLACALVGLGLARRTVRG